MSFSQSQAEEKKTPGTPPSGLFRRALSGGQGAVQAEAAHEVVPLRDVAWRRLETSTSPKTRKVRRGRPWASSAERCPKIWCHGTAPMLCFDSPASRFVAIERAVYVLQYAVWKPSIEKALSKHHPCCPFPRGILQI